MRRLACGCVALVAWLAASAVAAQETTSRDDGTVRGGHVRFPPFERDVASPAQSTGNVMPVYPPLLRIARVGGNVVAAFVVDSTGKVVHSSIQIAHATSPQLASAVLEALPGVRFTPAVAHDGRNVAQLVRELVEFRLLAGGMTQVAVHDDACTLANLSHFTDVPACASPTGSGPPDVPVSWGWSAGGENVTGAYARSGHFLPGVVAGVQVQFPLPSRHLALRVDGMYNAIIENDVTCTLGVPERCFRQGDYKQAVTVGVDMIARLKDPQARWSPYVLGGVGINVPSGNTQGPYDFRPNHGGLQGGVGFEYRVRGATSFVEARYIGLPPGGLAVWNVGFRY
jgi:TonB family protein